MAIIRIKDLPDSMEMDRKAMSTVIGGARSNVRRPSGSSLAKARSTRIVDYPGDEFSVAEHAAAAHPKPARTRG
jgi:hypothetical protein